MIRSVLYTVCFLAWTLFAAVVCLPGLLTRSSTLAIIRFWAHGVLFLARWIAGIRFVVRGREHLPDGPCIVAAQHQSAFETYTLFLLFKRPVFILKDSLVRIPLIGWYIRRGGLIAIDRESGARAMRRVLRAANAATDAGESLLIFPEGTRTPPGSRQEYKPGIVALYNQCDVPLVPMALNSGYYWGKTRVTKVPGTIVFQFLPTIDQGLDRKTFLSTLRSVIETAARDLPRPDQDAPPGNQTGSPITP